MRTPLLQIADMKERKLQRAHRAREEAMCLAFSRVANSSIQAPLELLPPKLRAARHAYDKTVAALVDYLGPAVPCECVDVYLWRYFVDWHKFVHGTRPHDSVTRSAVLLWIAQQEQLQSVAASTS
jgi:hypothetical protein